VSEKETATLEVRNLRVSLAGTDVEVLSGVDFNVTKGHIFGLVGESGSGKSTLARALLGYSRRGLRITAGSVRLNGTDVLSLSPSELRRVRGRDISYVSQDPTSALSPGTRIGTQLRDALTAHPEAVASSEVSERLRQVLLDVKLEPSRSLLRSYPHQLSGGQQQRVVIAMAFACRPSVIVLDEPTTGLDVTTQRHVLETIRELCGTYGAGAVYVTHDLAVVAELTDHVAVMYSGLMIENGPTREVFVEYLHPYTQGLIGAAPSHLKTQRLTGIPGNVPQPGKRPTGCHFGPRCSFAIPECGSAVPDLVNAGGPDHAVRCIRAPEWKLSVAAKARVEDLLEDAEQTGAILRAEAISASYGRKQVLKDVSISIPNQSCVAVVGESGSGKTTLARCLVGLHDQFTGTVRFKDRPLAGSYKSRSDDEVKAIQYIFQNPYSSLNPRRTVSQILLQPMRRVFQDSPAQRSAKIDAVLSDVSLDPGVYRDKYPPALSGGEAQRVAIARALLLEPELLICDEITSSLDASVQATILELLRHLRSERGLSMLFISHNLALVRSIAETVAVLHDGTVVENGPVERVLDSPSDEYTALLFESAPRMEMS